MMSNVEKINGLTGDLREDALRRARMKVAGPKPVPADEPTLASYVDQGSVSYPGWVKGWVRGLSVLMLVAAFLPSSMRLHEVGRRAFEAASFDLTSVYVAALATVVMAEIGQVIFSLSAAIVTGWWSRLGLWIGAIICTAIALTGNGHIGKPWATEPFDAFLWLETFAPPLLVLITAQVLKADMLHAIQERHNAQSAYAQAHAEWVRETNAQMDVWNRAYAQAHDHPQWMRYAANALRDALAVHNRRSSKVLREVTDVEWRELVMREMRADAWYMRAEQQISGQQPAGQPKEQVHEVRPVQALYANGNAPSHRDASQVHRSGSSGGAYTGETQGQVLMREDGVWTAECPHCGRMFEKDSERGARNALASHVGRFCTERPTQVEVSVNGMGSDEAT